MLDPIDLPFARSTMRGLVSQIAALEDALEKRRGVVAAGDSPTGRAMAEALVACCELDLEVARAKLRIWSSASGSAHLPQESLQ